MQLKNAADIILKGCDKMRCPECNTEYREGFAVCGECGAKLVSEPDIEDTGGKPFEGEALLANVNDPVQLSYITSMLEEERIPYREMEEEAGQYLSIIFGKSYFSANIYVGADDYEKATDIIASYKYGAGEGQ
jgi:hypothetical protein